MLTRNSQTVLTRQVLLEKLWDADENYVDEKTGEVIPSVGSADGTSLSDEKDAGGQTADAGAAENTGGQPAEPGVAENTGEQPAEADAAENQQAQIAEAGAAESQAASAVADIKAVTFAREKLNDFDYLIQNFYQVDKYDDDREHTAQCGCPARKGCTFEP